MSWQQMSLLFCSLLFCMVLQAQDDLDDVLGGFDEGGFDNERSDNGSEQAQDVVGPTKLTGSLILSASQNYKDHEVVIGDKSTDFKGLSKLRTQINLKYDDELMQGWDYRIAGYGFYDWVYTLGDDDFTDDVVDEYKSEVEIGEFWLQGQGKRKDVDYKIGRQVVNWGRSETLRVLDILNPLDQREVGLGDIENLSLPVFMLKRDYYFTVWNLSLIVIPETRFSKIPPLGSDFNSQAISFDGGSTVIDIPQWEPDDIDGTSWAGALKGVFNGWDLSFQLARYWNDYPYLASPELDLKNSNISELLEYANDLTFRYSRVNMVGAGLNYTLGSWMLKGEVARINGIDYTIGESLDLSDLNGLGVVTIPTGTIRRNRSDVMIGLEYYGIGNTIFTLEMLNRHISSYEDSMADFAVERDTKEISLRYDGNFINDRLRLSALLLMLSGHDKYAAITRFEAAYELYEAVKLSGGVLIYKDSDVPPFDAIGENDRLFAELKWSF